MKKHKVDHKLMKSIKEAHKEKHHTHKKHESVKHEKHEHKKHEKHESKKHEKHEHKKHEDSEVKKAMHHPDKLGAGAKKRKHLPAKKKVEVVMKEFKRGTLNSGSGAKVTNPKQAIAIGLSEARKAGAKIPKNKKK